MVAKSRMQSGKVKPLFCATRYGNVMASRGSVIPLFIEQLHEGKPLTVTDPNMTRFLMSLEDSVDLVSARVRARRARRHLCPEGAGLDSRVTWRRRCKELFAKDNEIQASSVLATARSSTSRWYLARRWPRPKTWGSYYRIPADNRDLNYDKFFVEGEERNYPSSTTTPRTTPSALMSKA